MAYGGSKKFVPRRGKARVYRRKASTKKGRLGKVKLDKVVQQKVRAAVGELKRGPCRSVPVRLTPSIFDRVGGSPSVQCLSQWTAYGGGVESARKYGLLPVSELIPSQRPALGPADDRFRSYDSVKIKGVSLRMTINYAEGARLRVFMFPNAARRGNEPSMATRPFVSASEVKSEDAMEDVKSQGVGPPSRIVYGVMSKDELMGNGKGTDCNMGLHHGPFDVCHQEDGSFDWHSPDLSAFMSRFTKGDGGPIGTMYARVNWGQQRKCGKSFSKIFSSTSLARTPGFEGENVGLEGWIGTQTVQVELFWKLNRQERFRDASGSLSVNERPLEIFVGFDSPSMLKSRGGVGEVGSGAIMGMDMEVYYE